MTTGLVLLKYLCYSSKMFFLHSFRNIYRLGGLMDTQSQYMFEETNFSLYCLRNFLEHVLYYQKKNFVNLHLQLLVCGSARNISRHFVEKPRGVFLWVCYGKKHLKCKVLLYPQPTSLSSDLASLCIIRDCITILNANMRLIRLSSGQIYCHFQ